MRTFAIVPVKGLNVSKERLSNVLSPKKRGELTAAMLRDVLNALKASTVREVLLVSPDSAVKGIAEEYGVSYLSPKRTDLNPSLTEAIEWCMQRNADAVLILPADIPLVSSQDLDKLVELGSEKSTVVLAPSMNGGTNALFLNPPDVIPVCFGPGSFFKHVKEAIVKKVEVRFHSSREIALDIDSEDDLNKLFDLEPVAGPKQVFKQIKPAKER